MNKEGIGVLGQITKYQEELNEIEQILGKALGYPWFKDDPKNFPTATEADGVCVGDHTAWSLAMCAADKIKELEEKLKNITILHFDNHQIYLNKKTLADLVDALIELQNTSEVPPISS